MTLEPLTVRVPVATVWTAPDAPREVDAPAVLDVPDPAGWTGDMDRQVRRGLVGRTLTQALLGEPVLLLEERGDWLRVACAAQPSSQHPHGYPGWVRRAHVGAAEPAGPEPAGPEPPRAVVVARTAALSPADRTAPATTLSFGTVLPLDEAGSGDVVVRLPDGGAGRLRADEVRILSRDRAPDVAAEAALALAARFVDLRYLWGGTSGWGVDCSGLVHLAFRVLGVTVARDAFDQADSAVQPVPLDDVRRGDLYFFARPGERVYHVGFASRPYHGRGARWMLHAPEGGELVEDAPMAQHRLDTLVSAGRVLPGR